MTPYFRLVLSVALLIVGFLVGPWLISAPSDIAVIAGLLFVALVPLGFYGIWREPAKAKRPRRKPAL